MEQHGVYDRLISMRNNTSLHHFPVCHFPVSGNPTGKWQTGKWEDRKMADLGKGDPRIGHIHAPTTISLILNRIISSFRNCALMARRLDIQSGWPFKYERRKNMNALWQDLRYGARMLWKKPGFTLIAVITLALGIGASAAIFSVVNVVILNPFPYRDHTRLFLVRQNLPKIGLSEQVRASGPEFDDFNQSQIFEKVAAFETVSRNLTGGQEPERVAPAKVSAEFFSMFGIEPLLGRV